MRRSPSSSGRRLGVVLACAGLVAGIAGCGIAASRPPVAGQAASGKHGHNPASLAVAGTERRGSVTRDPRAIVGGAPAYFRTLPPSAHLPSSAQCAQWVLARPYKENKGLNRPYNRRTGQHIAKDFFTGDAPAANQWIAPRVNGDFTGTTGQILRWAACKWGIDQDIVFAQAAAESSWRQTTKGDWETNRCPPGHGPGQDGRPGLCPQSWGILQNRYPFQKSGWPGTAMSTAMSADLAYAIWRACYDGYEKWLKNPPRGALYHAGDAWGCVGRWLAGRWRTASALKYIAHVRTYLRERIWTKPYFQQP